MYTDKQQKRLLEKLKKFEENLEPLLFEKIGEVPMKKFQTPDSYDRIPDDALFVPCEKGDIWSGEGTYCWFKGSLCVPAEWDGKELFAYPRIGGYEGMLWVNGVPHGIFTSKIIVGSHGNHYCDRIKESAKAGEVIDLALEYYAHHYFKGTQPFDNDPRPSYEYRFESVDICLKNQEIFDFYFDLRTVNGMIKALPEDSFRRADLIRTMVKVHEIIFYDYENAEKEEFMEALRTAAPLLKEQLSKKNSASAPLAGLIGHSHMDTAWLWHKGETLKKCARTYANQMNLMEQYPEYLFIQSSAYHSEIIREHYPELFEQIKARVKEGRYEPNGGVYIECDCNIPSGEYMIRQFLLGQKFTEENFGYRSDSFWLPDTFGYSVSLPQIMKGCGIRYFLTTKMAWNDTNTFPYDTFYWKGLDGSKVLVHLNKTHIWPDPERLMEHVVDGRMDSVKEKSVSNMRLLSYGFGDGGGGPEFGMIEMARRLQDTEGMPRTEHMTVSSFMHRLEDSIEKPSTYSGELYLELHRGTLTNQHNIKRNNRLAEIAIHNLEYAAVRSALLRDEAADEGQIRPLLSALLVNQFHDILPGTCIARAHDEAIAEVTNVIHRADEMTQKLLTGEDRKTLASAGQDVPVSAGRDALAAAGEGTPEFSGQEAPVSAGGDAFAPAKREREISVMNTLSFARRDVIYLDYEEGLIVEGGYRQQVVETLDGTKKLAVAGVELPPYAAVTLKLVSGTIPAGSAFALENGVLTAPKEKITFNEKGYLDSYMDLEEGRELRGEGYALNTFLIGEEVSRAWDNWDVDADFECKLKDRAELLERKVTADGAVEFRIRSRYKLSCKSTLLQDMIVYADSKEVKFETLIDWQDEHRFLKTAFDTTVFADTARQEVQFGYIKRPTTRNNAEEKAKFEVSNHKYTDLSETRYGAAVLNDCKYGISVEDSKMHLSLHKGGNRPDDRGDKGQHRCAYAFLPHQGGFSAESVIRPAYELNYHPVILPAPIEQGSLLSVDADHVIVETVKPAENGEKAFVLRLYEAEGAAARTKLHINGAVKAVELTNMLEEGGKPLSDNGEAELTFKPFEIKTLKVKY